MARPPITRKGSKMARRSVALVDTTGDEQVALEDIPDDLKEFVEDVYNRQRKTPGRERVTYDSDKERDAEYKLIRDYIAQRPQGVLKVVRAPSKDLPAHTMDLRFSADLPANAAKNANGERGQVKR